MISNITTDKTMLVRYAPSSQDQPLPSTSADFLACFEHNAHWLHTGSTTFRWAVPSHKPLYFLVLATSEQENVINGSGVRVYLQPAKITNEVN
jgi:hypothetical protein